MLWEFFVSASSDAGLFVTILQSALGIANIFPSATQRYPATDMEAAIEAMTQVPDSCIVHCQRKEVDEVKPWPRSAWAVHNCGSRCLVLSSVVEAALLSDSVYGSMHYFLSSSCMPAQLW